MFIYHVTQQNQGYDVYTECIVAANNIESARMIHPSGIQTIKIDGENGQWFKTVPWHEETGNYAFENWKEPGHSTVYLIGEYTGARKEEHVICANYREG